MKLKFGQYFAAGVWFLNRDFEIEDLCGTCDMNSTLGYVMPLAMFDKELWRAILILNVFLALSPK